MQAAGRRRRWRSDAQVRDAVVQRKRRERALLQIARRPMLHEACAICVAVASRAAILDRAGGRRRRDDATTAEIHVSEWCLEVLTTRRGGNWRGRNGRHRVANVRDAVGAGTRRERAALQPARRSMLDEPCALCVVVALRAAVLDSGVNYSDDSGSAKHLRVLQWRIKVQPTCRRR